MADKFFLTTAIDYPNSRPHIGTAFEKIGADVQARYRRMQGDHVFFLMGNDENTTKVSKRAAELGKETQAYCDDMARQFREVWDALDISYDIFVQTSSKRHHDCCRKFIQRVYDNGFIRKDKFEGWYCVGCEEFKTEQEIKEAGGVCPNHKTPPIRRSEPCYIFEQSKFSDRLLKLYEERPELIQPETRRNEIISLLKQGLRDLNITRTNENWGIRVPWDESFTIYVWFDALLTYITGIGYGDDEAEFSKWWPCETHFIGKDITRFHCATWPAMLLAAGVEPPKQVFGHGFVYIKNDETGAAEKISKSLGNVVEPMDIVTKFSGEAFRYYFMRECPFPGDGEFSWQRFADVYNSELANNLGNLYSRVITLVSRNYGGSLASTAGKVPALIGEERGRWVQEIQGHVEACQYNQALQKLWQGVLVPTNQHADRREPWKQVKTDKSAAAQTLFEMIEPLRAAAILLKPFLPRSAETIYRSFNFAKPWEQVRYEDAAAPATQAEDLRITATLEDGKVKPLFPRIQ
ncbi:MAG: methionine--tRNA ligase [Gemmataceae bacterium]